MRWWRCAWMERRPFDGGATLGCRASQRADGASSTISRSSPLRVGAPSVDLVRCGIRQYQRPVRTARRRAPKRPNAPEQALPLRALGPRQRGPEPFFLSAVSILSWHNRTDRLRRGRKRDGDGRDRGESASSACRSEDGAGAHSVRRGRARGRLRASPTWTDRPRCL